MCIYVQIGIIGDIYVSVVVSIDIRIGVSDVQCRCKLRGKCGSRCTVLVHVYAVGTGVCIDTVIVAVGTEVCITVICIKSDVDVCIKVYVEVG